MTMLNGNPSTKTQTTFKLRQDVIDQIREWAASLDTSQANVIETLVDNSLSGPTSLTSPTRRLTVSNLNPLIITGDFWQDSYTGYVIVELPETFEVRSLTVQVKKVGLQEFTLKVQKNLDSLQEMFT